VWAKSEATMLIHKQVLTSTHPANPNPQAPRLKLASHGLSRSPCPAAAGSHQLAVRSSRREGLGMTCSGLLVNGNFHGQCG
jgi:hypothetical protein